MSDKKEVETTEEVVNEVPAKEVPEQDENQKMLEEVFDDGEAIDAKEISKLKEPRPAPSASRKTIKDTVDDIELEDLTEDEQVSIILQRNNKGFIESEDTGYREDMVSFTNKVDGEKPLHSKALKFNKKVSSGKAALLKLKQASGLGSHVNIALWHSGFYITMAPLTDEEILRLELEITEELTRIGKATNTLIFSNYSVIFTEVIFKHFRGKIIASSLDIGDDQDILDYIHINDVNAVAINIAMSIFPNGFNAVIPCSNDTKLKDGKPACNNVKRVKLALDELQWEDLTKLTPKHIQQMNKTNPKTVSIEDVIEYQKTLPTNGEVIETFTLPYEDESLTVDVTFQSPNISYYLEAGKDFISTLRHNANQILKESTHVDKPEDAEELLVKSYYLQLYIHYIKSIKIDDAKLTSIEDIKEALNTMVSNDDTRTKFLADIHAYIDNSLVSIVGIPNFRCESCNIAQSKHELIPLAVFEYFFILLHSRYEKVMDRYQKEKESETDI